MGVARWPIIGLVALCACTGGGHTAAGGDSAVMVRPGLWSVASVTDGVEDPSAANESCLAERTWFAMASLTSGSREMGCGALELLAPRGRTAAVMGARETCRQGSKTVIRTITLENGTPAGQPLTAFDEVTRLRIVGQPGEEISRTRHTWLGACPGPDGKLLGLRAD